MCLVEVGLPRMGPDRKPVLKADGTPEIGWLPRPQIGCATQAGEGMSVRLNSQLVKECRRSVLEFLLINHPLDCPICDQAGECKLQEYAFQYGGGESRFVEEKERKPKKVELGPRVTLDDERCILCTRCVRFCREIARDDVLGIFNRGSHSYISCYPGRKLENNYSLNTVDLCPVGALTSTDFRFKMRVWFLKETSSLCASCARGCNITVGSREGVVHRFKPRCNDAVNSHWMCDEGRLNYKWINDERRLKKPLIRASGSAKWDEALAAARDALVRNRGRVAILASGQCSCEELFLLKKLAETYGAVVKLAPAHEGPGDNLLVETDKTPNMNGVRLMGFEAGREVGAKLSDAMAKGEVAALVAVRECAVAAGVDAGALKKMDAILAIDVLPSPTVEMASVVLPGAAHVEKTGTFINFQRRLQRFHPAFAPPGEARTDLWILGQLPGGDSKPLDYEKVFNRMCGETPAFQALPWEPLTEKGVEVEW